MVEMVKSLLRMEKIGAALLLALLGCGTLSARTSRDSLAMIAALGDPRPAALAASLSPDSVSFCADVDPVIFVYQANSTQVRPDDRVEQLVATLERLRTTKEVRLVCVKVIGSASPAGSVARSERLAAARAEAFADYLCSRGCIDREHLEVEAAGADWEAVERYLVANDFPHSWELLWIIRTEKDPVQRKLRIQALEDGAIWYRMVAEIFPPLHNVRVAVVCRTGRREVISSSPVFVDAVASLRPDNGVSGVSIIAQPQQERPRRFYAVKTNALFLGVGVVNAGAEIGLGRRWSLDLPICYSPYNLSPRRNLRLLAVQPEGRFWFKEAGTGHFVGLHAHLAAFNVAINDHGRYQDPNDPLWGFGIGYGYALDLGRRKNWGVEFNIGAGFAKYRYDAYRNETDGARVDRGSGCYWGVTRAGISFYYKWRRPQRTE